MLSAIWVIAPIFGLILVGAMLRRTGVMGPEASPQLNRYVVWLGLPALLFEVTAHATWAQLDQPGFVGAFGIACLAVYGVTVIAGRFAKRHLADTSVDGLAAAYPNTGYIGFPLCLMVLGKASLTAVTIATIVTVCVLFALAIVMVEISLQAERNPVRMIAKVLGSLARNPLVVAPVAGAILSASGLKEPQGVETFMTMLAGSASPCALVGLGLFLAEKRPAVSGGWSAPVLLSAAKLFAQPLLTWVLARLVFHLEPIMADSAVLIAALPTGTGPFMLAEFYGREAVVTSRTILISTIGALVTLTVLVFLAKAPP